MANTYSSNWESNYNSGYSDYNETKTKKRGFKNDKKPVSTKKTKTNEPAKQFSLILAEIGLAATLSALATKCLDLVGKDYMNLSAFFGQPQLISQSSFLTGGLAYASYEAGSAITKPLLGRLSPLAGFAATAVFAHFASVPLITALSFTILGIAGSALLNLLSDNDVAKDFYFVTVSATGGLIYEGGVHAVKWLTGFNALSLGLRNAAWAGVFGFGVMLAATASTYILVEKITGDEILAIPVGISVGILTSCYLAPVPVLVNAIMLSSSLLTLFTMK